MSGFAKGSALVPVLLGLAAVFAQDAAERPPAEPPAPSFTFHPRSEWTTEKEPVEGPAMDLSELRYITIHYNGDTQDLDGKDDVYQDADFAGYLRKIHHSYLTSRKYSLGYNSIVAPDGDEWEVRGFDFRNAANGCEAVNRPGYALKLVLPTPGAEPTLVQIQGLKRAIRRIRDHVRKQGNPDTLELNGHRDVRPECGKGGTGCPGEALYRILKAGGLEP